MRFPLEQQLQVQADRNLEAWAFQNRASEEARFDTEDTEERREEDFFGDAYDPADELCLGIASPGRRPEYEELGWV